MSTGPKTPRPKRALAADFCRTLRQGWPAARFHSTADGLPGLVSVGLPGQDSNTRSSVLDLAGVCVSPGAACDNTGRTHPSHVLLALGGRQPRTPCVPCGSASAQPTPPAMGPRPPAAC